MVEINISRERAESIVEQMEDEQDRMTNTLNSFRSNNLTHTEAYIELKAEWEEVGEAIADIEIAMEEEENEEDEYTIAELFN